MNHKKFANQGHKEGAGLTTREVGKPLSKGKRWFKRYYRRVGKRKEEREAKIDVMQEYYQMGEL